MTCSTQILCFSLVLLHLLHNVVGQTHYDDFFLSISPVPSVSVSSSTRPTHSPTKKPTSQPSNNPSYLLQEFQFSVEIEFNELQVVLDKESQKILENATNKLMKKQLEQDGNYFFVDTTVIQFEIISRSYTTRRLTSQQDISRGLKVSMNIDVSVRSETVFTVAVLIERMKLALDEEKEREEFILKLQYSDNSFSPVNSISKFIINDEEIELINQKKKNWYYILQMILGIGLGMLLAFLIIFLMRKRTRTRSTKNLEKVAYVYPHRKFPIEISTINMEQHSEEVSALDMKHCTSPQGSKVFRIFYPSLPKFSMKPLRKSEQVIDSSLILQDYDYKNVCQTSTHSLSSQSETELIYNSTKELNKVTKSTSVQKNKDISRSRLSEIHLCEDTSFKNDEYFEAMYSRCDLDKRLESSF